MSARLLLYSRTGCHLCEVFQQALAAWGERHELGFEVRDVDADEGLRERYGDRIPVLALDGEELMAVVFDADLLEEALRR